MRPCVIASLGLLTLTSLIAAGCSSHADNTNTAEQPAPKPKTTATSPQTDDKDAPEVPEPVPVPEAKVNVSVASVQLLEDCPEPKKKAARAEPSAVPAKPSSMAKPAQGARAKRKPGSAPLRQPCTQSSVQLSVASHHADPTKVELVGVRLRLADGKDALSAVPFRDPKVWAEQRYDAWDGVVGAKAELKASYNLGLPDWNAVEKAVGGSSFGPMYVLEFDVTIDGIKQTVESTAVPRERPARVVT